MTNTTATALHITAYNLKVITEPKFCMRYPLNKYPTPVPTPLRRVLRKAVKVFLQFSGTIWLRYESVVFHERMKVKPD